MGASPAPAGIGLCHDPLFLEHVTGQHPERPARLVRVHEVLRERGLLADVESLAPPSATVADLELAHTPNYVRYVERVASGGGGDPLPSARASRASAVGRGRGARTSHSPLS